MLLPSILALFLTILSFTGQCYIWTFVMLFYSLTIWVFTPQNAWQCICLGTEQQILPTRMAKLGWWKGGRAWKRGKFSLPLTSLAWNHQKIFRGIKIEGESLISPISQPSRTYLLSEIKVWSDAGCVRLTWFWGRVGRRFLSCLAAGKNWAKGGFSSSTHPSIVSRVCSYTALTRGARLSYLTYSLLFIFPLNINITAVNRIQYLSFLHKTMI